MMAHSDEYYLAMAALDQYESFMADGLPKSTSVVFRIHQLGHAAEALRAARTDGVVELSDARWRALQRALAQLDPMRRSSPETISCRFCGADKGHSYVTGDRTPHAEDCEWRLACEASGMPWDFVL